MTLMHEGKVSTLRTYAVIFRSKRRCPTTGALMPISEISLAAAEALEFMADDLELTHERP